MIVRGNNVYRSLEEQVFKNQSDIKDLTKQVGILGIKVVKQVDEIEDLPSESSEEFEELAFGDAYAVGDAEDEDVSYQYVVKVADNGVAGAHWLNLGHIRGEKGADSDVPGPQGNNGTGIYLAGVVVTAGTSFVFKENISVPAGRLLFVGDLILGTDNGLAKVTEVLSDAVAVSYIGSIKGAKGDTGPQGPKGDPGDVVSVNTKTGEVVLSASDIKASNAQTIQANLERIDERIDDFVEDNIEGSDTIVVDLNEDDNKYQIRLDQDVIDIIDKVSTLDVVQTTGTSTEDVMSQKASTDTFAQKSDLDDFLSLSYSSHVSIIPDGTDFNDLTTPGNYRVSSIASMQTMLNTPTDVGSRVEVLTTTSSSAIIQLVIPNKSSNEIYYRVKNGASANWNEWTPIISNPSFLSTNKNAITSTSKATYFSDCNDAPENSIFTIYENAQLANSPNGSSVLSSVGASSGYCAGTLITFKAGYTSGVQNRAQLFITFASSPAQSFVCVRTSYASGGARTWTPWIKLSDYSCLTSSNEIITRGRVEAEEASFNDLNNAKLNSVYQIDLDCSAGVLNHHPMPGHSCVLVTIGSAYSSRHGAVQMCFGLDNGAKLCFRYGYLQAPNDYRWTSWEKCETQTIDTTENDSAFANAH